jgi:hypothetical protein
VILVVNLSKTHVNGLQGVVTGFHKVENTVYPFVKFAGMGVLLKIF